MDSITSGSGINSNSGDYDSIYFESVENENVKMKVENNPDVKLAVDSDSDIELSVEKDVDIPEDQNVFRALELSIPVGKQDNIEKISAKFAGQLGKNGIVDKTKPIEMEPYQGKITKYTQKPDGHWGLIEVDATMWKIKVTWEIKVDGETITKSAWMKTPIELPKYMDSQEEYRHSQYLAYLHTKATISTYKSGLDPKKSDYDEIRHTIEYLRDTNILVVSIRPSAHDWTSWNILRTGEVAYYSVVKLEDLDIKREEEQKEAAKRQKRINEGRPPEGEFTIAKFLIRRFKEITGFTRHMVYKEISYSKTGYKTIDGETVKFKDLDGTHADIESTNVEKYMRQQFTCSDPRFKQFEELTKTPKEGFLKKFKEYQNSCSSIPNYAMTSGSEYQKSIKRKVKEFEDIAKSISIKEMIDQSVGIIPESTIEKSLKEDIEEFQSLWAKHPNLDKNEKKQLQGKLMEIDHIYQCKMKMDNLKKEISLMRDHIEEIANDPELQINEENKIDRKELKELGDTIIKFEKKLNSYNAVLNIAPQITQAKQALGMPA